MLGKDRSRVPALWSDYTRLAGTPLDIVHPNIERCTSRKGPNGRHSTTAAHGIHDRSDRASPETLQMNRWQLLLNKPTFGRSGRRAGSP